MLKYLPALPIIINLWGHEFVCHTSDTQMAMAGRPDLTLVHPLFTSQESLDHQEQDQTQKSAREGN